MKERSKTIENLKLTALVVISVIMLAIVITVIQKMVFGAASLPTTIAIAVTLGAVISRTMWRARENPRSEDRDEIE